MKFCLLWIIFFFFGTYLFAAVKLPAIFSDKMVLQQRLKVAVWGWADPGEGITIKNSWSDKIYRTTASASGDWKLMVQTPKAGGPYNITISGKNVVVLHDVLIGEVWVCSGQSNMVMSLKTSFESEKEIPLADLPDIRYFSVNRQYGFDPFQDAAGSMWQKTSHLNAGSFSAVAYYFAKKIHKDLKVPVGIIYAAWGGTPAEAWTPNTILKNDSALGLYIKRWDNIQKNVGKDSVEYHSQLTKWEKDTTAKKPAEPQTLYYYNRPWREPGVLFNGMINPIIPFGLKGFLWYQGESNVSYANEYYHLFSSMINSWKDQWLQKDLSFYFVQLPPYGYSDLDAGARIREAQYRVMQNMPGTGMAVTMDIGNMKDIHPTRKREVGERLALIALANDYGAKNIIYKGPEPKKIYADKGKVIIEFRASNSLLITAGNTLKGFEIGYKLPGVDSIVFIPASAKIDKNMIIVWDENVKQPVEIRYGWLLPGEANLFNKEGLPAFPFRKKID